MIESLYGQDYPIRFVPEGIFPFITIPLPVPAFAAGFFEQTGSDRSRCPFLPPYTYRTTSTRRRTPQSALPSQPLSLLSCGQSSQCGRPVLVTSIETSRCVSGKRMTQRNQFRCPLPGLNPGDPRDLDHIAFGQTVRSEAVSRSTADISTNASASRLANRFGLRRDVHHSRTAHANQYA